MVDAFFEELDGQVDIHALEAQGVSHEDVGTGEKGIEVHDSFKIRGKIGVVMLVQCTVAKFVETTHPVVIGQKILIAHR